VTKTSTITKNEPVWFMSTWAAWPFVKENEAKCFVKSSGGPSIPC
jgi:hypothetical protein